MLNHLLRILRINRPKPLTWDTITKRTTKDGDKLTDQESVIFNSGKCPDCGHILIKGPEGCGSINMYCLSSIPLDNPKNGINDCCGSRYNNMGPFGGERINDSKGAMILIEENKPKS